MGLITYLKTIISIITVECDQLISTQFNHETAHQKLQNSLVLCFLWTHNYKFSKNVFKSIVTNILEIVLMLLDFYRLFI